MLPPRTIRSVTKEGEAGVPPWIRIGTGSEKKGEKKKRRRRNVTTVIQRRGQGYNAFYHARRHAYFSLATHGNFDSTDQRRASSSVQRASALTSPILYNSVPWTGFSSTSPCESHEIFLPSPYRSSLWILLFVFSVSFASCLSFLFIYLFFGGSGIVGESSSVSRKIWWRIFLKKLLILARISKEFV